jgi:ABC-type polysaccharide/polyol phosphate transport system ATPase subunit
MTLTPGIVLTDATLRLPVNDGGLFRRIASTAPSLVGGQIAKQGGSKARVAALEAVSLRIREGERVAVVGANGSGKTTLLRLIAGIYQPNSGRVEVTGSVSCLFSAGLGLRTQATGWENIRFACILYGFPPRKIPELSRQIAEFSELGAYLDLPLSAYSAGMRARLGFSVITALEPDILLIDEVFGAGDPQFQKKARARIAEMMERSRILMLASQSNSLLKQFCETAVWLHRGELKAVGPLDEILKMKAEALGEKKPAKRLTKEERQEAARKRQRRLARKAREEAEAKGLPAPDTAAPTKPGTAGEP